MTSYINCAERSEPIAGLRALASYPEAHSDVAGLSFDLATGAHADPLDTNEAATIGQNGQPWLDTSSTSYLERSTKPCVAPCRPLIAPH
jgi:hypothetical protein